MDHATASPARSQRPAPRARATDPGTAHLRALLASALALFAVLAAAACTAVRPAASGNGDRPVGRHPPFAAPRHTHGAAAGRPATAMPGPPTDRSPEQVVRAYYRAIGRHHYRLAWRLGGRNLAPSYPRFVRGLAGARRRVLTVQDTYGNTVAVHLAVHRDDGSVRGLSGLYTVVGGVITSADVVESHDDGQGLCGAPWNPHGYNFCGRGVRVRSPASDFCVYFGCVAYFERGRGYVVQCADGGFSRSGGEPRACSAHGGVRRTLYVAPD